MKRLIFTLLSSIVFFVAMGQSSPMVVIGDMKVAANGKLRAEGPVNMKTTTVKKAVMVNDGVLNVASGGIIFYSDPDKDGILMTSSTGSVVAPTDPTQVKVHRIFADTTSYYYYAVSFPFDVNVNAVRNAVTGATNLYQKDGGFWVYEYDSQARANTGKLDGNWKYLTGTTLKRGIGYRIFSYTRDLEFPAATYPSNRSDSIFAYNNKILNTLIDYKNSNPAVYQDYQNGRGWNYIGALGTSNQDLGNGLPANGRLSITVDGVTWNRAVYYMQKGTENFIQRYLVTDAVVAPPFAPFFVQVVDAKTAAYSHVPSIVAQFGSAGITVANTYPADYRASSASEDIVWSLNLQSDLRGDDAADHVYLAFGDNYNDDYRVSEDAYKMTASGIPQLWAVVDSTALFVDALSLNGGKEIQLGFSVPEAGKYTLNFSNKVGDSNFVKNAELLDKSNGSRTDVLAKTYSFTATAPIQAATDRFVLYVNHSATGIDVVDAPSVYAYVEGALLTVKNVASGDKIQVFDLAGRIIASGIAQSNEFSTPLNQKGVFIVNVKGEKSAVLKVLSK